jgi:sugar/nucleoside kinase (ribokinase family)
VSQVAVLGDVMIDIVVAPREPLAPTSDTAATVRLSRGGSAANLAVALRAAGHEVAYFGVVGDDLAGEVFQRDLEARGVAARLERVTGATGVVVALVGPGGQRSMFTDRGVNGELGEATVSALATSYFTHLHVSGYTLLDGRSRAHGVRALEAARRRGATTSVDVCSVGPLTRVGTAVFRAAFAGATWLFANEEEALALAGVPDVADALTALGVAAEEVVVTCGSRGARVRRGAEEWRAPARATEVLDTTGAGDAATGAYLGARLAGDDVAAALTRAMDAAAEVVRGLGSAG